MNYQFNIKVDADSEEAALRVRDMVEQEIGAAFELDSQDIKGVATAHTGDLEVLEDPEDAGAIAAARAAHESEGSVEIDDSAKVSYSTDGGAYVAAWVWVGDDDIVAAGGSNPETGAGMPEDDEAALAVVRVDAEDTDGGACD